MNRLIIVGSPRTNGRSAHLAELLFESCIEECPHDEVALVPVSTLAIEPCQGCDACKALAERAANDGAVDVEGPEDTSRRCVINDDMAEVYELIDAADELVVVSPVYFAGAPAQLKALIDRLQPYFWTDARHKERRPATLHVVGEGGDPYGFEPLVGVVRSALACAGFDLECVLNWVGKIDANGEIAAEADEYSLESLTGQHVMDTGIQTSQQPQKDLNQQASCVQRGAGKQGNGPRQIPDKQNGRGESKQGVSCQQAGKHKREQNVPAQQSGKNQGSKNRGGRGASTKKNGKYGEAQSGGSKQGHKRGVPQSNRSKQGDKRGSGNGARAKQGGKRRG